METHKNVQEFLDEHFEESKVVLNLDLDQFSDTDSVMSRMFESDSTSFLSGNLIYLVNRDNNMDKSAIYVPDPENMSSVEIISSRDDVEKAEMILASCLMVNETEVSDEYIENAHFYLDMDKVMGYYGLPV